MSLSRTKVNANPTKSFFVRMITRDISLTDCIFDLIDNSIDSAWEKAAGTNVCIDSEVDLKDYSIKIEFSEEHFSIQDNCGGICFSDAVDYAFTFGRRDTSTDSGFGIGVYGIGMKRAIFKIGEQIIIHSTVSGNEEPKSFCVPINVPDWLSDSGVHWDFDIEEAEPQREAGVTIRVHKLTEASQTAFINPRFIAILKQMISRDYAIYLHNGLNITINGDPVRGWGIEFRQSDEFSPMRTTFIENIGGEDVFIELLAGMVSEPSDDEVPPEKFDQNIDRSGWYIGCNGRLVVSADKTSLSGWGTEKWPQWHPQYAGFMGMILFSSKRPDLLPLTTTKRNVDESSVLFRRFRPAMRDVTKEWIKYTNSRKQSIGAAKVKEKATQSVSVFEIKNAEKIKLPSNLKADKEPQGNIIFLRQNPKSRR